MVIEEHADEKSIEGANGWHGFFSWIDAAIQIKFRFHRILYTL